MVNSRYALSHNIGFCHADTPLATTYRKNTEIQGTGLIHYCFTSHLYIYNQIFMQDEENFFLTTDLIGLWVAFYQDYYLIKLILILFIDCDNFLTFGNTETSVNKNLLK